MVQHPEYKYNTNNLHHVLHYVICMLQVEKHVDAMNRARDLCVHV